MHRNPVPDPARLPSVVPLFGGGDQVPSPVLVRGSVGRGVGAAPEGVRAAEAVASALGELVREASGGERRPRWERPVVVDEGELMRRSGLLHAEVREGLDLLVEARTAFREGDAVRLDASVAGELPCLARVDWERVREGVRSVGGSLAPALAVLREVARRAEPDAGGAGGSSWVSGSLPALAEGVGYGRTAASQALSALVAAGVMERGSGRGLRVRLLPAAFGGSGAIAPEASPPPAGAPPAAGASSAEGTPAAVFGTHPLHLPPGMPLELEALEGGGSRLRLGPLVIETAPDGAQTLVYGALRIRA